MLIRKSEKIKVTLNSKNIKKYKKTSRILNQKYNEVLSKLLTDKYSLPTREEWDTLMSKINKLRKEINDLKPKKKTEEEIFRESLRVFRESQGELVKESDAKQTQLYLVQKEERLKILLEYKNNLHILANNSDITITTVHYILGSCPFDSALGTYFRRTVLTSIDRFKSKPKK